MSKPIILDDINCLMCRNSREQTMEFQPWYDTFTYRIKCVNCGVPGPYGDVDPITDVFYSSITQTCWVDGGPTVTALTCKNFRPKVKPNA